MGGWQETERKQKQKGVSPRLPGVSVFNIYYYSSRRVMGMKWHLRLSAFSHAAFGHISLHACWGPLRHANGYPVVFINLVPSIGDSVGNTVARAPCSHSRCHRMMHCCSSSPPSMASIAGVSQSSQWPLAPVALTPRLPRHSSCTRAGRQASSNNAMLCKSGKTNVRCLHQEWGTNPSLALPSSSSTIQLLRMDIILV